MKFGLIGGKLGHSFSPEIHQKMGLDYATHEIASNEELSSFVKSNIFDGYNVTIPYKQEIIKFLDEVSPDAHAIGAVNTVINKNGILVGYNTDIIGMDYALRKANIALTNKNIMILGSGGTAHTAAALAKKRGAKSIITVSRNGEVNYDNCNNHAETNIIINCTPVGMYPDNNKMPINIHKFPSLVGVYDAIYNPLHTRLCQDAKQIGIAQDNGLRMLVAQAKFARDIFVGENLNYAESECDNCSANYGKNHLGNGIIEEIYNEILAKRENIVLIGMPGSGKTTIGRRLAQRFSKCFIDTDEEIVKLEGRTIPNIFETNGEAYFRKLEKAVIAECSVKFNQVIATGGGAVMDGENAAMLALNSYIINIDRELSLLDTTARPKSDTAEKLQKLYDARTSTYNALCDVKVPNNDSLETAIKEICDIYGKHIGN